MARLVDLSKLEKIKTTTMESIVQNGYEGVTISSIAKKAGVSSGYLYTHFQGKEALIDNLTNEIYEDAKKDLERLINEGDSLREITKFHVSRIFKIASINQVKARFICTLIHDERFIRNFINKNRKIIEGFGKRIFDIGIKNKEIGKNVTINEILLILVKIPIDYIFFAIALNGIERKFSEDEINRVTNLCLNAIG